MWSPTIDPLTKAGVLGACRGDYVGERLAMSRLVVYINRSIGRRNHRETPNPGSENAEAVRAEMAQESERAEVAVKRACYAVNPHDSGEPLDS